jgi:hypothetical protein
MTRWLKVPGSLKKLPRPNPINVVQAATKKTKAILLCFRISKALNMAGWKVIIDQSEKFC